MGQGRGKGKGGKDRVKEDKKGWGRGDKKECQAKQKKTKETALFFMCSRGWGGRHHMPLPVSIIPLTQH